MIFMRLLMVILYLKDQKEQLLMGSSNPTVKLTIIILIPNFKPRILHRKLPLCHSTWFKLSSVASTFKRNSARKRISTRSSSKNLKLDDRLSQDLVSNPMKKMKTPTSTHSCRKSTKWTCVDRWVWLISGKIER